MIFRKEVNKNSLPPGSKINHLGGTRDLLIRLGYNELLDKFWFDIFHRETKDQMRILLNYDETRGLLINLEKTVLEYLRDTDPDAAKAFLSRERVNPGVLDEPKEEESKAG